MPVYEVEADLSLRAVVKMSVTADSEEKAVAQVNNGISMGDIVGDRVDVMTFVNMASVEGEVEGVKLISKDDEEE